MKVPEPIKDEITRSIIESTSQQAPADMPIEEADVIPSS